MSTTRLTFRNITATDAGLVIGCVEIIDTETGIVLKVAKITAELVEFIGRIEIDLDVWYNIEGLKEKNPNVTKLINNFRLFT
jgi:hypothetical protein